MKPFINSAPAIWLDDAIFITNFFIFHRAKYSRDFCVTKNIPASIFFETLGNHRRTFVVPQEIGSLGLVEALVGQSGGRPVEVRVLK